MIVGVSPLQFILWHFSVMAFCLLMKCKGFSFKIRLGTLETILLGGCHHIGNYKVILFKQQGPYKAKQNRHTDTPTELCFMPVVSYPTLSFAEKKNIFFSLSIARISMEMKYGFVVLDQILFHVSYTFLLSWPEF